MGESHMDVVKKEVGDTQGIADNGLCVGVEVARRAQHKVAEEHGEEAEVYSLRPDVEFDSYGREDLEGKGLQAKKDIEEVESDKVAIGVRGAPPQVRNFVEEHGIEVLQDTTCPYVKIQEQEAEDVLRDGRHLIFLSDPNHHGMERLRGIAEEEGQKLYAVQRPEQVEDIDLGQHAPVGVLVQTTFWMKTYERIVTELLGRFDNILIKNTACEDSLYRLPEMERLCQDVDGVVVVGWSQGMVNRMNEVADYYGTPTQTVDPVESDVPVAEQLDRSAFGEDDTVGVIAANVTPDEMVDDVVDLVRAG
jgi:4-hydroxy-3-methylbut-2-enyl diphosphate reductase